MKHLRSLYTLLFGVAVLLFFGLAYPHHLHYQEQYQLFLFDSTYVWEIVKLPGGVADLLGRFCTQFLLFAWVGALVIALLLVAVHLLTFSLLTLSQNQTSQVSSLSKGGAGVRSLLYGLSFVPSFLLWLFLLDENALLGGVWAVLRLVAVHPACCRHSHPLFLDRPRLPPYTRRQPVVGHPLLSLPDSISVAALGCGLVCLRPRFRWQHLPPLSPVTQSRQQTFCFYIFLFFDFCDRHILRMEERQFQGRASDAV